MQCSVRAVEPVRARIEDLACAAEPERYFYADHESGAVKSFALNGSGQAAGHQEHAALRSALPTSFGVDGHGEMYVLELEGDVFKIAPE